MMDWLKKLMILILLILVIQLKKTDYNTKINETNIKLLIIIMLNILQLNDLIN